MRIKELTTVAKTKWLNLFTTTYLDKNKKEKKWDFVSRKEEPFKDTKRADAVVIVSFLEEKMVLIKQYRPAIDSYIIENVAGLIDKDKSLMDEVSRELKEETGLVVDYSEKTTVPYHFEVYIRPIYNSPGLTDESVCYVFCEATGTISNKYNEETEDIEVIVVDQDEAKALLDTNVKFSAKCWLILMAYADGHKWF